MRIRHRLDACRRRPDCSRIQDAGEQVPGGPACGQFDLHSPAGSGLQVMAWASRVSGPGSASARDAAVGDGKLACWYLRRGVVNRVPNPQVPEFARYHPRVLLQRTSGTIVSHVMPRYAELILTLPGQAVRVQSCLRGAHPQAFPVGLYPYAAAHQAEVACRV